MRGGGLGLLPLARHWNKGARDISVRDLNKRPEWKQPTPSMQLTAILGSLEGHKSNHEEGIITDTQYIRNVDWHIDWLIQLRPFIERGTW